MKNNKIAYFMCTNKPVTGAQKNILNILAELSKSKLYEIYYINNYFSEDEELIRYSNIIFVNVRQINEIVDENITIITALNYLPFLAVSSEKIVNCPVCLYCYDHQAASRLKAKLDNEKVNDFFDFIIARKSIFYLDYVSYIGALDCNINDREPKFIPYVDTTETSNLISKEQLKEKGIINVGFINSAFDRSDNIALNNLIMNINRWFDEIRSNAISRVVIHVFGTSSYVWNLRNANMEHIDIIYVGPLLDNNSNDYIYNAVDIAFARGTTAFITARMGIPTLLYSSDSNDKYRNSYVSMDKSKGYSIDFSIDNAIEIGQELHSLQYYFCLLLDNSKRLKWRNEIMNSARLYNISNWTNTLVGILDSTELSVSDCINHEAFRNVINNFSLVENSNNILDLSATDRKNIFFPKKRKIELKGKADVLIHSVARKIRYYKVQNRYPKKVKEIKKILKYEKQIKVAFLVLFNSVFPLRTVFEKMLSADIYDPYIIAIPNTSRTMNYQLTNLQDVYDNLSLQYPGRVICGYDSYSNRYYELKDDFQIVFFANPYKNLVHPYHEIDYFIKRNVLTVFANYGFAALNFWNEYLDSDFYNYLWLACIESTDNLKYLKQRQSIHARNALVTGYIKMDKLPQEKKVNKRKKIMICPHHTVWGWKTLNVSNFLKYKDFFIELPKMYPQIDFVFRPHPLLFPNLKNYMKWTQEDVDSYLNNLLSSGNVIYDVSGDYLNVFNESDAMIHDCGSFIGEYLYTSNPCCYLMKSEKESEANLLPFGQKCIENYYHAFSEEDICKFINDVVINGNDYLKEKREKFAESELKINYPYAADYLIKYITERLIN